MRDLLFFGNSPAEPLVPLMVFVGVHVLVAAFHVILFRRLGNHLFSLIFRNGVQDAGHYEGPAGTQGAADCPLP